MIISDNETKFDLINNKAIAKTIVSLIEDSSEQPISIGIHGDWGAGKSSILEMVEGEIDEKSNTETDRYCCIRYNGWKHQGFEDAKISLMSSIVSELTKKEELSEKAKDALGKIWKNINWMSVAKNAGKAAIGIATGTAPITILSSALDLLKKAATTKEGLDSAIDKIDGFLKDSKITEDTSSNLEFSDFQENFLELLDKANIKKLVVLIDDLDRCLPDVAIDTLEAVRLFMFTGKTAFVIAADEDMIRYAVKKHFPDVVNSENINAGIAFSNKYLEKLIQVPFRIPALGEVESCNYIMLLMIGSVLKEDNENYKKLCNECISRIQKPWDVKYFSVADVSEILGDDYGRVESEVLIATQICHLLAKNTNGNPRKIKRFINMLLLRYKIAINRGFGTAIELPILAKMMLAEYYATNFYKNLPSHLSNEGSWDEIEEIKERLKNDNKDNDSDEKEKNWYDIKEISDWILIDPSISGKDLRPYYYACKEKVDYFAGRPDNNDLTAIVSILFEDEMIIASHKSEIEDLSEQEAEQVFDIVSQKLMETGSFQKKPKGVEGLAYLTSIKTYLRKKLVSFIKNLPKSGVGVWILSGWDKAIPKGTKEHDEIDTYLSSISEEDNKKVNKAFNTMRGK